MECCCYVLASVANCYLNMLHKLQKRVHRIIPRTFVVSLEPIVHCRNMASLSFFYEYYFGRCPSKLVIWFHFRILVGVSLVILIGFKIFLSPFLNVTRISVSILSFLTQLGSGTYRQQNVLL